MNDPVDILVPDAYLTLAGGWLVVGVALVLGAAIGSFLNVVAYRLPRGMSLSTPGSRCPACGHPIRWYDNVPVVGWLMLAGRCRDCGAAISPRYPVVELLVALASAVAARCTLLSVAADGTDAAFAIDVPLLALRLLLIYTLVCAALLEFDGWLTPLRLLVAVLVILALATTAWTRMLVDGEDLPAAIQQSAVALGGSVLLGLLAWPMLVRGEEPIARGAAGVLELALVGTVVPLAGVAASAVFAQSLFVATRLAARRWPAAARFGWAAALALCTLIWMAAAAVADRLPAWVHEEAAAKLLAAGAVVALLSLVGRALPSRSWEKGHA